MSKYLIIPDVHLDILWAEAIIEKENADQIIFLGDFFDSHWFKQGHNAQSTATWLKASLQMDNRIHLFGNHDIYYAYYSRSCRNAGFTEINNTIINSILEFKDWNKFCWFYQFKSGNKKFLCTHAGLSAPWLNGYKDAEDYLIKKSKNAREALQKHQYHEFWHIGPYHGGKGFSGGILWCRPPEFFPIIGTNQLFGHTFQGKEEFGNFSVDGSENFCLDGAQSTYAVVVDGEMEFKSLI